MLIFKIALGLIGLGVVVFVHELGHFLGARLMGITVEAFSIGWGKPILKKKIGKVEYRLGLFPLGGYCKMKGENEFAEAYSKDQQGVSADEGSYFSAHPFRRVVTCAAGPLFNIIFAILVLSVIWGVGFEVTTRSNRVVLLSDIVSGSVNPADMAGLKTGDRILEIRGKKIEDYHGIQENIAINPEVTLPVIVERDGRILELAIRPSLEKSTGAGKIGVYDWTDPIIEQVSEGSPAAIAGLQSGDRILTMNGIDFPYTVAIIKVLDEKPLVLDLEYERGGRIMQGRIHPSYTENGIEPLGIMWKFVSYRTPRLSPPFALAKGIVETWKTFAVSVKSLSLLFRGVDLTQAVSGPVRITYMVGDIAAEGFNQSFGTGISSMASFLALISIALCIMNLLPLPILDGGMILLFLIEGFRKKPLHPRFVTVFQSVGVAFIACLMLLAVFGDILYLVKR